MSCLRRRLFFPFFSLLPHSISPFYFLCSAFSEVMYTPVEHLSSSWKLWIFFCCNTPGCGVYWGTSPKRIPEHRTTRRDFRNTACVRYCTWPPGLECHQHVSVVVVPWRIGLSIRAWTRYMCLRLDFYKSGRGIGSFGKCRFCESSRFFLSNGRTQACAFSIRFLHG